MRTPSKHELKRQVNPDKPVFVQDPPEGSAAEQSPTVSALGRSSDASQFAKTGEVREGNISLLRHWGWREGIHTAHRGNTTAVRMVKFADAVVTKSAAANR